MFTVTRISDNVVLFTGSHDEAIETAWTYTQQDIAVRIDTVS